MATKKGGLNPLSPSATWSPHTAALHRRRRLGDRSKNKILGAVGDFTLDDDEDIFAKSLKRTSDGAAEVAKTRNNAKQKKKQSMTEMTQKAKEKSSRAAARNANLKKKQTEDQMKESIKSYDPKVQAKLAKIINPKTPMKERLQLEVDMMKNEDERKILADFRYQIDRKSVNVKIFEQIAAEEEQLMKVLSEEEERAEEERQEMARVRQEKVEEEIAKAEREAKLKADVRKHRAKGIAQGAEAVRIGAEKSVGAAVKNKAKKEEAEREKEKRIQEWIDGPGQYMTDVERELQIALMLNEEVAGDE